MHLYMDFFHNFVDTPLVAFLIAFEIHSFSLLLSVKESVLT